MSDISTDEIAIGLFLHPLGWMLCLAFLYFLYKFIQALILVVFAPVQVKLKAIYWVIGIPIYIIIGFKFSFWYWNKSVYGSKKFNSEEWIQIGIDGSYRLHEIGAKNILKFEERCDMCIDLTDNYLKIDMTILEVETLLGRPNSIQYCLDKEIKCLEYSMGVDGSNPKCGGLTICFNRKLKVIAFNNLGSRLSMCDEDEQAWCLVGKDSPYSCDNSKMWCNKTLVSKNGTVTGWSESCKIERW